MESMSRRNVLAVTAAGGISTASVAAAQTVEGIPQPRRPGHGGTDPGPRNLLRDRQSPDELVPPSTDHGSLPNLRFSFSEASTGLFKGGWTRQVSVREFGIATTIAGTNMRLNHRGVREMHWHKAAKWAYMLYGNARITAVDAQGRNFDRQVIDALPKNKAAVVPALAAL
jgi:oxalate decarboxylase